MSIRLRNAPPTLMKIFFRLVFVFLYLDGILMTSLTDDGHTEHLKLVYSRLEQHGLRINIENSVLGVSHLEFLGYMITP